MKKSRRYGVYVFPSLYGTPFCTDWYAVALVVFYLRSIISIEARLVDHKTDKHLKVG